MVKRFVGTLLFAALVVGCSRGEDAATVAAGADGSDSTSVTRIGDTVAGELPGFPATVDQGCSREIVSSSAALYPEWVPINSLVNRNDVAIRGVVASISEPRITTIPGVEPPPFGTPQAYFRLLSVQIVDAPIVVSAEGAALKQGNSVDLVMFGAGTDYPEDKLCYGFDGMQDSRQVPLKTGDQVILLASYEEKYPIANLVEPVLVLESPPFGVWKIEPNGFTEAPTPAYELEASVLMKRIDAEIGAGLIPLERLAATDALSTPPESITPTTPSTTAPPPPGADATNSPTVTTSR